MQAGVTTIAVQGIDLQVVRQGTGQALLLLHGGDGPQSPLPSAHGWQSASRSSSQPIPALPVRLSEHFDTLEDLVYLYLDRWMCWTCTTASWWECLWRVAGCRDRRA